MNWIRYNSLLFFKVLATDTKRYIHYPLDFVFLILIRFMIALLLVLFWYVVASNSSGQLDTRYLVGYSLVVGALFELGLSGNWVASNMGRDIKSGAISQQLIRPINPIVWYVGRYYGIVLAPLIGSIVMFVAGIYLIGFGLSPWLPLVVVNMLIIGLSINVLIGTIAFYVHEMSGIKNTISHVSRFLQGGIVPLALFPVAAQSVLRYSPFPSSVSVPILSVTGGSVSGLDILVGSVWAICLLIIATKTWKKSLKSYDAVGA